MITEDYVSFETAKLLKENKFNEFCWYVYLPINMFCMGTRVETNVLTGGQRRLIDNDGIDAMSIEYNWHPRFQGDYYAILCPTPQMAMKWLREKGFHIFVPMEIDYDEDERGHKWYHDAVYYPEIRRVSDGKIMYDDGSLYAKPEQACEAAIKYCLENLI